MDDFKPYEQLFTFGLFVSQMIAILLAVFLFLVVIRESTLIVAPFMLFAGFLYSICCFIQIDGRNKINNLALNLLNINEFLEKLVFTVVFLLANLLSSTAFLCASFHVLEMSPTSHRATIGGLITSTGAGIAKLVLLFSIKYLKVCTVFIQDIEIIKP